MRPKPTLAVASVLALLATSVATSALAEESIGVVKRSKGPVLIERGGEQTAVSKGTEVRKGDRLVTGADGHVIIGLRRGAPLYVGPQADVDLDRFAAEKGSVAKRTPTALVQGLASYLAVNRQR